jgi:hypothetical protein
MSLIGDKFMSHRGDVQAGNVTKMHGMVTGRAGQPSLEKKLLDMRV